MTPANQRLLGQLCIAFAFLLIAVAVCGRLGLIPQVIRLTEAVITALLFSFVGRALQRRARAGQA